MAKKYYKKRTEKKKIKEVPVCCDCLRDPTDSDLKDDMFFWVLQHDDNFPSLDHYTLHCIDCIEKNDLKMDRPYKKKKGRPKGTKNKKKSD